MAAHETEHGMVAACDRDSTGRSEGIVRHIARGAWGRIYDLRVECDGRQLVLRGRSRTHYAKQLAQQAALELAASTTRVVNRISVI